MKFCEKCDNMYYLKLEDEESDQLHYYCRNCGFIDKNISLEHLSVYKYESTQNTEKNVFNAYTKIDHTLPRLNTIKCPNDRCTTNTNSDEREVIYLRYDDKNMKYMYLCCKCDFKWKT